MSRIILLMHLSSFLVAHLFISGVVSTTFTITNSCKYTVWPGVSSEGASAFSTTGFSLEKDESKILKAPASWNGRFWGRTYCTEDDSGNFSCITGDCGSGKLECSGSGGAPPATLAEFVLGGFNGADFYDVSLVDGFNLPLLVVPSDQNCSSTGCFGDVNECKSARDALGLSISNTTYMSRATRDRRQAAFISRGCVSRCRVLSMPRGPRSSAESCPAAWQCYAEEATCEEWEAMSTRRVKLS